MARGGSGSGTVGQAGGGAPLACGRPRANRTERVAAQDGTRTTTSPTVSFVDEPTRVRAELAAVDVGVVGIDVERADADRYFRRAALIQVGADHHCVLLDAVALPALPQLDALLDDDHLAVLHAADNDLEPLARLGVRPARIADTAIAAALLGLPTGLSKLLGEVLEVELTSEKESFQRADWEQRPLPADMAAYAAGDVVHLPALWSALAARLDDAGRRGWYDEELAVTLDQSGNDTRDWTRVKGAGRLDPQQGNPGSNRQQCAGFLFSICASRHPVLLPLGPMRFRLCVRSPYR